MSHRAPAWCEATAERPAGSSKVHSTIKPCSLRPETPAPLWRSCTELTWSRPPSETGSGHGRRTRTWKKRGSCSSRLWGLSAPVRGREGRLLASHSSLNLRTLIVFKQKHMKYLQLLLCLSVFVGDDLQFDFVLSRLQFSLPPQRLLLLQRPTNTLLGISHGTNNPQTKST